MIKNILIFMGIVLVILVFGATYLWFFPKEKIGDLRPATLPPSGNIAQDIEQKSGEPLNFPLNIPGWVKMGIYAKNLGRVRGLAVTDEGTVLATTLSISGGGGNRVFALVDRNNDGIADQNKEIITGIERTHGISFYKGQIYLSSETKLDRYNFDENNLTANFDKTLFTYPAGGLHFTRSVVIDNNGKVFVSLGSTCNACIENNPFLAAVISSDINGSTPKLFASGLRNSVGLTINPRTGELWGVDNGRDQIGDDIPPDEVNIIREGKNYGWPNCYGDKVYDEAFGKNEKNICLGTEAPVFNIQAHSAPLGIAFIPESFNKDWVGDLLVSYHGSWNRSVPTGYKVVRLKVSGEKILGQEGFIEGFLKGENAMGRPVDLKFDNKGNLFISDDKSGVIYIINKR